MKLFSVWINAGSQGELASLSKYDLDLKTRAARQEGAAKFRVPGILNEDQIRQLEASGFTIEIVADLAQVAEDRRRDLSSENRFETLRRIEEYSALTVQGYMTADEVESALKNLSTQHADLLTLIELPYQTWEGRTSHAVRLHAGTKPSRKGVLFTGSMHAREWGGSDICVNFLVNLINAYLGKTSLAYGDKTFSAKQISAILKNIDIFVFPDVNPDGKNYSQTTDMWWRKNRNPNHASSGVDLNRNFDFLWDSGIGTTTYAKAETYRGEAPLSEPETKNVCHLFDAYKNVRYFVDIHSWSGLILYSWGDDKNQSVDPSQNFQNPMYDGKRGIADDTTYQEYLPKADQKVFITLANRMNDALAGVRGKRYTVQQSVGLYPTSATSDDYALSRHFLDGNCAPVYGFAIEFGEEFIPAFSEMRNIISEVAAALTELCVAVTAK